MSSNNFYVVSSSYDELEIIQNGEWNEKFREVVVACIKHFCYDEMFPVDIKGVISNTRNPIKLLIIANNHNGKSVEIREPKVDETNGFVFESALYVLRTDGEVQKRVLIKGKKFEAYLNSPEETEYVVKGEFATRDAFSLEQKLDDLVINLKLFSVLRSASYTPTMALDMVLTVLQIEKTELKNLEIPNLNLKIKDFQVIEAFVQKRGGCFIQLNAESVKYESHDFLLELIIAKQVYNMSYRDFRNFTSERVANLYNDAEKSIVDLQHEVAMYNNM